MEVETKSKEEVKGVSKKAAPKVESITETKSLIPEGFRVGSHQVILRQVKGFSMLPKDGGIRDEVIKKVGSTFKGGTSDIIRGLSRAEEKIYLPEYIGVNSDAIEWEKATRDFWCNFTIPVPAGQEGVSMEIGFREDGVPLNLRGYMQYKFCREHGRVAVSEEELDNMATYSFYIEDLLASEIKKEAAYAKTKEADIEFVKLAATENPQQRAKLTHILTIMAENSHLKNMTANKQEMTLKELVAESPDKFLALVKDKNLEDRALLQAALDANTITVEGSSYFIEDKRIGSTYNEAVGWLGDPNNSAHKSKMLARMNFNNQ